MNEINPDQILSQIRSLSKNLQSPTIAPPAPDGNFGQLLQSSLNAVNDVQQHAGELKVGFETGQGDASLAEVMIAAQKADLSFRAVTEVRNKLVQAYQDIMNMPV